MPPAGAVYRGSRKHVLDWTDRATFVAELIELVRPVTLEAPAAALWMPCGHAAPGEARLERFGPRWLPDHPAWPVLRRWWLAHERGANTPNWDLTLACRIEGRPGLVLVEAKANKPELKSDGKTLDPKASDNSRDNHAQIARAIAEAWAALRKLDAGVAIDRDTHYQLSNRVAFTWKLASLGIPTVLVYLGFCGDAGIVDAGEPFADDADWRATFGEHAKAVLPAALLERRLDCGAAPAWILVRSRPVLAISPPPK